MKNLNKLTLLTLVFVPILIHLVLLNKYALNIPFKDDYRVFIKYMYNFVNTSGFEQKLGTIMIPDNESHPILMHLITLVQYFIDGELDFRHILLFCNIFLLLFAWVLGRHFYRKKEYWGIAIMSLLVFNIFHHEMYYRTDVGTYQLASFAFSILMFYGAAYYHSITLPTKILFFIAFLLSPLGSINGMLANCIVLAFFALEKNWKISIIFGLILATQFIFLNSLSDDAKPLTVMENIQKYNFELVYGYFLALSGIIQLTDSAIVWHLMAISGVLVFSYTFYKLFFPFKLELNFEKMVFVFCSVSLALIVTLRYNYWMSGYQSLLESRYKLYGALIFIIFFALVLRSFKNNYFVKATVVFSSIFIFFLGLYKGNNSLINHHLEQITEAYNTQQGVYEVDFAERFYATQEMVSTLDSANVYSFQEMELMFQKIFTEGNEIDDIGKAELLNPEADPIRGGDRNLLSFGLRALSFKQSFPLKKYYFVRFNHLNLKHSVQFLLPPPVSILEKLGKKTKNIKSLNRDFYPDAFQDFNMESAKIFGLDKLPKL